MTAVTAHLQPSRLGARPSKATCEAIGRAVANERRISYSDLIFAPTRQAKAARVEAWKRIITETRCSREALADAWGVDKKTIVQAVAGV